jgi:formylglycine-generating enzyme required for sulfatase activity
MWNNDKGNKVIMKFEKFIFAVCIAMLIISGFSAEKIRVAIYREDPEGLKTYGETGIYDALKETPDIDPDYISEMTPEKLKGFNVLIITKKGWKDASYKPVEWKENVRKWAKEGHGVMAMHETAGCTIPAAKRYYKWNLFPEIGTVYRVWPGRELVMKVGHPITKNAAPNTAILNQVFRQGYTDYTIFRRGKNSQDIVMGIRADKKTKKFLMTQPAVLAGLLGKGRVVLNGMLTGFNPENGMEKITSRAERHILLDGVRWLASKAPIKKIRSSNFYIGYPIGNSKCKWVPSPDGLVLEETMSIEQLTKANEAFLKPILKRVNPPVLAQDIAKLAIGVLKSEQSKKWCNTLKKIGCKNVKELTGKDIEQGLSGVSVLVVANVPVSHKYVPVIKKFLAKGGKLLATESAGYDSKNGRHNLITLLHAGTYINTTGVEYFSLIMPEEFRRKEVDKRCGNWFVKRCETALKNGASGMAYFTITEALKQASGRMDVFKENGGVLHNTKTADFRKELRYITAMSSLWKNGKNLIHKNLPFIPQIGYLTLRHITVKDINFEALAEACKDAGINILTTQVAYIDRFYLPESKKGHITLLREHFLDKLVPELKKRGIQCWVNVLPARGVSKQYCEKHPEECIVNSRGKTVKQLCPVKGGQGYKYKLHFLKKLFSKHPYLNGISLDEPFIRANHCFCPECKKLFQKMYPGKKMTMRTEEFRKFREHLWSKYYVKPYAEFLRKYRPQNGVLMLASPGHNKPNWSQTSDELANSGVQLFANENAQTRSQCMFDEIWAKHKLKFISCNKLTFVKKHPLLQGIDINKIGKQAVKTDVFHGADALAYITAGECSYPGIIVRNDTSSIYFAFDPLTQGRFVTNVLNWFIANDRHNDPKGMVPVPAGKFKMKIPRPEKTAGRYPDEMIEQEVLVNKFYLDKCEVTNKEYERFDPKHKRSELSKGDNMPVTNISMTNAKRYCNWRSAQENLEAVYTEKSKGRMATNISKNGYRLPTVAEWQKAATGPGYFKYSWGNFWWRANGRVGMEFDSGAVKTGSYRPNHYGLFDMTGNVWEWCEGYENYPFMQGRICGGAWHSNATDSRVNFYNFLRINLRRCTIGFRCAKNSKNP